MENLIFPMESLMIICVLTEASVQVIKSLIPKEKELSDTGINIISIVVAILLCVVLKVSIFQGGIIETYFGCVLSGFITSRGSNFVHNVLDAVMSVSDK